MLRIYYKNKKIGEVKTSVKGLVFIINHNNQHESTQAGIIGVKDLENYPELELDNMNPKDSILLDGYGHYAIFNYYGPLYSDTVGHTLNELLEEAHMTDYRVEIPYYTLEEIKEELESLSLIELKNINNSLTTDGDTSIWYYTYQELYDMHFNNAYEFFKRLNEGWIDIGEEYLFYEQSTGNNKIFSISKEDLEETLRKELDTVAEYFFNIQDEEDPMQLIKDYSRDI